MSKKVELTAEEVLLLKRVTKHSLKNMETIFIPEADTVDERECYIETANTCRSILKKLDIRTSSVDSNREEC